MKKICANGFTFEASLLQVIDCLLETDSGMVIIDYKTDEVSSEQCRQRAASYEVQMHFYRRAVETILDRPVGEMYLYFLRPGVSVPMPVS